MVAKPELKLKVAELKTIMYVPALLGAVDVSGYATELPIYVRLIAEIVAKSLPANPVIEFDILGVAAP